MSSSHRRYDDGLESSEQEEWRRKIILMIMMSMTLVMREAKRAIS